MYFRRCRESSATDDSDFTDADPHPCHRYHLWQPRLGMPTQWGIADDRHAGEIDQTPRIRCRNARWITRCISADAGRVQPQMTAISQTLILIRVIGAICGSPRLGTPTQW